ncbi:MAG: tetratricopeptide repeat protein [Bryobacteraceae bacterium]
MALASPISAKGDPDALSKHAARAEAAIRSNNAAVAIEELQAILRIDPKNVNATASLGMVAFTQADYARAARQFQAALALSPSLWSAQAFLGMCRIRLGNIVAGRKLIEVSLPRVEDKVLRSQSGMELIESYTATADFPKALPILELLQRSDPTNTDVLYLAYRVHSDVAAAALQNLNTIAPDSVRVHEVLAQNFMIQERYSAAIAEYRRAIERGPRLRGLHFELGQAILAEAPTEENRESAMREFLAEIEIHPGDPDSTYKLGEIAYARSEPKKAKELFLRAVELRSAFGEAEIALGKILADEGDEANAIEYLQRGVHLKPENKMAHYRLAQLYRAQGRASDAEREFAAFKKLSVGEQSKAPR